MASSRVISMKKKQNLILAARQVFLRYGFKRVTMQDIAEAANMSRPAVYLVFANKEDAFKAVIQDMMTENLATIRDGLATFPTVKEQLQFAFEVWTVRPYELIAQSPDAKELIYCGHAFAKEIYDKAGREFELLLKSLIAPLVKTSKQSTPSAATLAHLLRSAARGFKETAKDSTDLRHMLRDFIDILLRSV